MKNGSLIELSSFSVPKFYLWIYKFFLTLPTPVRKKKEDEKILYYRFTETAAIENFQCQCLIAKNKMNFFLNFQMSCY